MSKVEKTYILENIKYMNRLAKLRILNAIMDEDTNRVQDSVNGASINLDELGTTLLSKIYTIIHNQMILLNTKYNADNFNLSYDGAFNAIA